MFVELFLVKNYLGNIPIHSFFMGIILDVFHDSKLGKLEKKEHISNGFFLEKFQILFGFFCKKIHVKYGINPILVSEEY